jgi:hypothetical protein
MYLQMIFIFKENIMKQCGHKEKFEQLIDRIILIESDCHR